MRIVWILKIYYTIERIFLLLKKTSEIYKLIKNFHSCCLEDHGLQTLGMEWTSFVSKGVLRMNDGKKDSRIVML